MNKPHFFHMMWSANSDFQELPQFLRKKKAVVNVINNDQRSFGYSILSAKYYQIGRKNKHRLMFYDRLFNAQHLTNLPYPVCIDDIEKYEKKLKLNINIITFSDDAGRDLSPLYVSNKKSNQPNIDLLYWNGHFAWVRNRSRLLSHLSKRKVRLHFCIRCFNPFKSETILNSHERLCIKRYYPTGIPKITASFPTNNTPHTSGFQQAVNNSVHNNITNDPTNDPTKRGRGLPSLESTLVKRSKPLTGIGWLSEQSTIHSASAAIGGEKFEQDYEERIDAAIASNASVQTLG